MSRFICCRALPVFLRCAGLTLCFAGAVGGPAFAMAQSKDEAPPEERPKEPAPPPEPEGPGRKCTLLTPEAPRGGRIDLEVQRIGRTPLVLIAGRVSRLLLREDDRVAAQIHRDSNGGPVTIKTEGERVACGHLTIIGKD